MGATVSFNSSEIILQERTMYYKMMDSIDREIFEIKTLNTEFEKEYYFFNIETFQNLLSRHQQRPEWSGNRKKDLHLIQKMMEDLRDLQLLRRFLQRKIIHRLENSQARNNEISNKQSENKLKLPVMIVKNDDEECSICCEKYKHNDQVCVSHCKHSFHYTCLNNWVEQNSSCPLCRKNISST